MMIQQSFLYICESITKMKKKIIFSLLAFIVASVGLLIIYIKTFLPNVGPPEDIKIEANAEIIERGRYLANNVAVCMDCHSQRDWSLFSGPLVEGTLGQGGEIFDQKFGFPGAFYSKNITPHTLSKWTDGEILRAVACGVNKDGKALFPIMPHPNYGKCDKKDLESIIAYLRTLKPIAKEVPQSIPDFPMNLILNTIPTKANFSTKPSETDAVAYGKYLFTMASCNDCHTKQDKGAPLPGMESAGGFEFPLPTGGKVYSANITQDKETGIGNWTEEAFVTKFRSFSSDSAYKPHKIEKNSYNSIMPWAMYGNMKVEDLKAIYAYLKTVKPVKNQVVKFKED